MKLENITSNGIAGIALCLAIFSGAVIGIQSCEDRSQRSAEEQRRSTPVCVKEVAVVCKSTWNLNDDCKEWNLDEYTLKTFRGVWGKSSIRIESKKNLTEKYTYESYQLRSYDIVCKEWSHDN